MRKFDIEIFTRSGPRAMEGDTVRRSEIIAALSLATDLAIGQPVEFAFRSCGLSVAFAETLGLASDEVREVYYQSLLRYIGCNADTYALAAILGDEMELRRDFTLIDMSRGNEVAAVVLRALRRANTHRSIPNYALAIVKGMIESRASYNILAGHCEVAERLVTRLGFDAAVARNVGQLYERWDGKGVPHGLKGEAIAPAVRLVTLVQDAIVLSEAHGQAAALAIIKKRRGGAYDPRLVNSFLTHAEPMLARASQTTAWEQVLELEPRPHVPLSSAQFDEACLVIADFVDIRSPLLAGHSRAVATLAEAATRSCGMPESDVAVARRAGLVHDLGEVAVPMATWIKSVPLSDREQDGIRMHPHHTERVLARSAALRQAGTVAGQHHERLDGSGYHRGLRARDLPPLSRILAAAEAYQTKIEARPHRAALSPERAADEVKRQVRAGALDGEAVAAVLNAAGHRVAPIRRQMTADLTSREIDVLRLVGRGLSAKQIARELGVSPKTADNHTQNIYAKIGVSTRPAAALFAIEHGLLTLGEQK